MSVRHVGYQHPLSAAINTTYSPFKSFISTHQSLPLTAVVGSLTLEVRASKTSPQWFVRPWISVIATSKYRRLPTWDINKFIFYCSHKCEIGFYVLFSFYAFHSIYIFIFYSLFYTLFSFIDVDMFFFSSYIQIRFYDWTFPFSSSLFFAFNLSFDEIFRCIFFNVLQEVFFFYEYILFGF